MSINNFKKITFYLKKLSINFYFKEISKYNLYFYNIKNNINNNFLKIQKLYNSIISNKFYNPYKLDIISENSNILKACSVHFDILIRNYQNIKNLYK
jgi:hypothetical protein